MKHKSSVGYVEHGLKVPTGSDSIGSDGDDVVQVGSDLESGDETDKLSKKELSSDSNDEELKLEDVDDRYQDNCGSSEDTSEMINPAIKAMQGSFLPALAWLNAQKATGQVDSDLVIDED